MTRRLDAVANARKEAESQLGTLDNALQQRVERRMQQERPPMTEQPSGIEAADETLPELLALFNGIVGTPDERGLVTFKVHQDCLAKLHAMAARPAASGDLRERIARIVDPMAFETPKHPAVDDAFWRGASREAALVKADAILAALPGRDEEAIRKDERERCAEVAHDVAVEQCSVVGFHIAAAIRSLKTGSEE